MKKIDPRPCCANHFREHLLRYFGKHLLGLGFLAIASEQQKSSSQPLLARIETDPSNPPRFGCSARAYKTRSGRRKHFSVSTRIISSFQYRVKVVCNRGRCSHSNRLTCHAPLAKKVTGSQNRQDCFFADRHYQREGALTHPFECTSHSWQDHLESKSSVIFDIPHFSRVPAESRKAWASKPRFCVDFLLDLMLRGLAITCMTPPLDSKATII